MKVQKFGLPPVAGVKVGDLMVVGGIAIGFVSWLMPGRCAVYTLFEPEELGAEAWPELVPIADELEPDELAQDLARTMLACSGFDATFTKAIGEHADKFEKICARIKEWQKVRGIE